MEDSKRYVRFMLSGTALMVFLVAGVNVFVDPYAVFGTPRVAGINEFKPFAGDRGRVGKLHQVLRVKPNGLIVGNSRAEMGISPEHPCWPAAARPVYNIALPGLSVYNQVRYAQHAQALGEVRALVMGVDFLDFLAFGQSQDDPTQWPPSGIDVDAEPYLVDPKGQRASGFHWVQLADYVGATLSLNAFFHSLETLVRQSGESVPTRTEAGFNLAEGIFQKIVRVEGAQALFDQKNLEIADRLKRDEIRLFASGQDWSPDFEALRRLMRQGREASTATVLFISPYHAEYLLLLDAAGLWPQFEMWKRHLAALARTEGLPLWDFSGFDVYSTESVDALPPRGSSLKWFWEPAHYRRELGNLVLANIWRDRCPTDQTDLPPYGMRIDNVDVDTLDAHLAAQRSARDIYKAAHPEVVARIEKLFKQ